MQFTIPKAILDYVNTQYTKSNYEDITRIHIFTDCVRVTNAKTLLKVLCANNIQNISKVLDIKEPRLTLDIRLLIDLRKYLKLKEDMLCKIESIDTKQETLYLRVNDSFITMPYYIGKINFLDVETRFKDFMQYNIFKNCHQSFLESSKLYGNKIIEYDKESKTLALRIEKTEILSQSISDTQIQYKEVKDDTDDTESILIAFTYNLLSCGLENKDFTLYIKNSHEPSLIQQGNKNLIFMPKIL